MNNITSKILTSYNPNYEKAKGSVLFSYINSNFDTQYLNTYKNLINKIGMQPNKMYNNKMFFYFSDMHLKNINKEKISTFINKKMISEIETVLLNNIKKNEDVINFDKDVKKSIVFSNRIIQSKIEPIVNKDFLVNMELNLFKVLNSVSKQDKELNKIIEQNKKNIENNLIKVIQSHFKSYFKKVQTESLSFIQKYIYSTYKLNVLNYSIKTKSINYINKFPLISSIVSQYFDQKKYNGKIKPVYNFENILTYTNNTFGEYVKNTNIQKIDLDKKLNTIKTDSILATEKKIKFIKNLLHEYSVLQKKVIFKSIDFIDNQISYEEFKSLLGDSLTQLKKLKEAMQRVEYTPNKFKNSLKSIINSFTFSKPLTPEYRSFDTELITEKLYSIITNNNFSILSNSENNLLEKFLEKALLTEDPFFDKNKELDEKELEKIKKEMEIEISNHFKKVLNTIKDVGGKDIYSIFGESLSDGEENNLEETLDMLNILEQENIPNKNDQMKKLIEANLNHYYNVSINALTSVNSLAGYLLWVNSNKTVDILKNNTNKYSELQNLTKQLESWTETGSISEAFKNYIYSSSLLNLIDKFEPEPGAEPVKLELHNNRSEQQPPEDEFDYLNNDFMM